MRVLPGHHHCALTPFTCSLRPCLYCILPMLRLHRAPLALPSVRQAVRQDLKRHYAAAALGMGAFFAEDLFMDSGFGGFVHAGGCTLRGPLLCAGWGRVHR